MKHTVNSLTSVVELARETSWADWHCGLSQERLPGLELAGEQLGEEQGWGTARVGRALGELELELERGLGRWIFSVLEAGRLSFCPVTESV